MVIYDLSGPFLCIFKIIYEHIFMFLNMFYPIVYNVIILIWFVLFLALSFCSSQLVTYWASTLCWVLISLSVPWSLGGRGRQTWRNWWRGTLTCCGRDPHRILQGHRLLSADLGLEGKGTFRAESHQPEPVRRRGPVKEPGLRRAERTEGHGWEREARL